MEVIHLDVQDNTVYEPAVICVGYFDGLHRGHMTLIRKTLQAAAERNRKSALFTFDPDPAVTVAGARDIRHITPLAEKLRLLDETGIDIVYILSFTKETSQLSHQDFTSFFVRTLRPEAIICGFDYHYGMGGRGTYETLRQETVCPVYVIESVDESGTKISSTRIIQCIQRGDVKEASILLGRYYSVSGKVVHGRGKGHLYGFPTANVHIEHEYIRPMPGVYSGYLTVNGISYKSMINIGHNPTYNYRSHLSVEAHILDFSDDIYEEEVRVAFVDFMRPERRFGSADELLEQLGKDRERVREELPCTMKNS